MVDLSGKEKKKQFKISVGWEAGTQTKQKSHKETRSQTPPNRVHSCMKTILYYLRVRSPNL